MMSVSALAEDDDEDEEDEEADEEADKRVLSAPMMRVAGPSSVAHRMICT